MADSWIPRSARYTDSYEPDPVAVIVQGETSALRLNISQEDVTGWSFHAQIRPTTTSSTVLAEWLPQAVDARPLTLFFHLDPEVTAGWAWSSGVFGVEATSPDGQVLRLAQMPVRLDREVVRARPTLVTAGGMA